MAEWLAMGGYGAFVWSAYGIALIVLVGNVIQARRAERSQWQRLQRRHSEARQT